MHLDNLSCDYQGIDNLRVIRNKFIHAGGHTFDKNERSKINNIKGVTVDPLITIFIHDEFVWSSLEHVKKYLIGVTKP
jgi:hypothetical protein